MDKYIPRNVQFLIVATIWMTNPLSVAADGEYAVQQCGDVVKYIVAGDAKNAARCCDYPLVVNGVYPVFQPIKNEQEFVRWFPVIFDNDERAKLLKIRDGDKKTDGWGFKNWQGEMYGSGNLWRTYEGKRLFAINDTSKTLYAHWRREYARDLQSLAPQYRNGCRRVAYYFVSEDHEYFGRVDLMGDLWSESCEDGPYFSKRIRIMLFKAGQKSSDVPWRELNYDAKEESEHPNGCAVYAFASRKDDFTFDDFTFFGGDPDTPDMSLRFGARTGHETYLRLERSPVWPPDSLRNVCDLVNNTFRVLIDGDNVEEQPDGTILVKGKKTYLHDKNGEPLGAAWYDLWMTPDGKVVRKIAPYREGDCQDPIPEDEIVE